ncbi:hypothetical protein D4758_10060 [Enterocloster citroniae]|nr:hypothetical protein [Enterocloster citroniae]
MPTSVYYNIGNSSGKRKNGAKAGDKLAYKSVFASISTSDVLNRCICWNIYFQTLYGTIPKPSIEYPHTRRITINAP